MDGVSVVIPCFNEAKYIADCITGLLANDLQQEKLEILVVDGQSTDTTRDIVAAFNNPAVKLIDNPKRKTPFALNLGIANAAYNKILIAGAHASYPENYIARLVDLLKKPEIDVVGGALETKTKNINEKTKAITFVLSHKFGVGNATFRLGANHLVEVDTVPFGLYNKSVFEKVGGYNEKLIRNHDMELSSRIKANGFKIWLYPELKCTYYARETFVELMKNNFGNGFWNLKTLKITGKFSSLSLRHYIPLLFVLSLIVPPLAYPILDWYAVGVSVVSAIMYLLLVSFIAVRLQNTKKIYVVLAFLSLHFSYGFGSLLGIISFIRFWK